MAVQVRFISIVIPIERINASSEPGGFAGLLEREAKFLGKVLWHDDHLYVTSAMNPMDAQDFVKLWESKGLVGRTSTNESRQWKDMCVVDYYHGPTLPCDWLQWDASSHSAWLKGTEPGRIAGPEHFDENPLLVTPAMMQQLGNDIQIVGVPGAKKPWWKFW